MGDCCSANYVSLEPDQENLHEKYRFGRAIGGFCSSSGSVMKAVECGQGKRIIKIMNKDNTNQMYVIKGYIKNNYQGHIVSDVIILISCYYGYKNLKKDNELYLNELSILNTLNSISMNLGIPELIEHGETADFYYMVTKYYHYRSVLDGLMNHYHDLTPRVVMDAIVEMLDIISFCHDNNIIHNNIKPENFICWGCDEEESGGFILMNYKHTMVIDDDEIINNYKIHETERYYYLSPEIAALQLADSSNIKLTGKMLKASDVWSVGVIAYILMVGRRPFNGKNETEILQSICSKEIVFDNDLEDDVSGKVKDILLKLLDKDSDKRIAAKMAVDDIYKWIDTVSNDKLISSQTKCFWKCFQYNLDIKHVLKKTYKEWDEKVFREYFCRLDGDGDGFLDAKELTDFCMDTTGHCCYSAKLITDKMLRESDTSMYDADFEEVKQVWYRNDVLITENEQYIHGIFNVFDYCGTGFMNTNEMMEFMQYLHPFESYGFLTTVESIVNDVSCDGDSKIGFEEFRKACLEDIESCKWTF